MKDFLDRFTGQQERNEEEIAVRDLAYLEGLRAERDIAFADLYRAEAGLQEPARSPFLRSLVTGLWRKARMGSIGRRRSGPDVKPCLGQYVKLAACSWRSCHESAGVNTDRDLLPATVRDPLESHAKWASDIEETQNSALNFPLLADADRRVAQVYDMVQTEGPTATVRSVFIIDPKGVVRLTLTYPASTGRNFEELLRVIDSLQLTDSQKVATPANWRQGDEVVILPAIANDEADRLFPQGYRQLKSYLRLTRV